MDLGLSPAEQLMRLSRSSECETGAFSSVPQVSPLANPSVTGLRAHLCTSEATDLQDIPAALC